MDGRTLRKARSHEKILGSASRILRERGPSGMSVDELMDGAGLTRGGFYAHFEDKDALVAAALDHAFEKQIETLFRAGSGKNGKAKLEALFDRYLTHTHIDATADGCPAPALGGDVARGSAPLKRVFRKRILELVEKLQSEAGVTRREAFSIAARWFGALMLARGGDRHFGDEILAATSLKKASA